MKIVINNCYGGFGLSPLAISKIAEAQGKKAYFFKERLLKDCRPEDYRSITLEQATNAGMFVSAFSVPNPNELLTKDANGFLDANGNKKYQEISINYNDIDRNDPLLIKIVEELGSELASESCAELKVIEIPDDVEWQISEYDGIETVEEKHRSWN